MSNCLLNVVAYQAVMLACEQLAWVNWVRQWLITWMNKQSF